MLYRTIVELIGVRRIYRDRTHPGGVLAPKRLVVSRAPSANTCPVCPSFVGGGVMGIDITVRWVSSDGRILAEENPGATRPGFTWRTPVHPCAASLHLVFSRPEPLPCEAAAKLHSHVLSWLRSEQKIKDAAEVVAVTGFGTDGPGSFPRSFSVGVHWRNRAGSDRHQEFGGDAAVSLLYWAMAATQPPREP